MTRDGRRLVEALVGNGRVWADALGLPWGARRAALSRGEAAVMKAVLAVDRSPRPVARRSKTATKSHAKR